MYYLIRLNHVSKFLETIPITQEQYSKKLTYAQNKGKVTTVFDGFGKFVLTTTGLNVKNILISKKDYDKIENKKNFEIFLA